ncbi:nuclear transport factor 2 family protein [Burkholderia glumae]|uniref:nuclear transport factor 2 family protein n=1 Tax=Burkholderia glumae TaxID=337 RepID=UPI00031E457F|nr:nuclear transport factor 2 family protein [Burkholderia glumae]PJO21890.1 nuclear transport factor 2 family protein [Burkholderia glumae AU6208]QHE12186.1 nuclear transport factor 2 family protein [Burkholderia glumae AU6208]QJP69809.1 nuclear transport factor 2 family protein [Burkholderia glumae]
MTPIPSLSLASLASLAERLSRLEAEREVRHAFTRYMALCDVPVRPLAGESLAALFTADAIWEGVGRHYEHAFGRHQGRAAIVAMLSRYLPPTPHFATNTHFVTAETIEVAHDARRATGRWIMMQASGYVDGRAELIGARLVVDFVPDADSPRWRIAHLRTERLFDAPWQVNPRAALPPADGSTPA